MAKKTTVYFAGPCLYACVLPHNMKPEGEYTPKGGQYSIMVGLEEDDWDLVESWVPLMKAKTVKKMEKAGKNVPEGMDPDLFYVTFKRNNHVYSKDGDLIRENGAPEILDGTGEGGNWNLETNIGNGSVVTVKLEKYDGETARGPYTKLTLEAVRVDEHVPYEGGSGPVEQGETITGSGVGIPFGIPF